MKKTLLFLFLIVWINSAFAECSFYGMQVFPQQKNISLNSIFIIQGYSFSQQTIESFKNRKVYLESETGHVMELELQQILKGQMDLTQAIFKPMDLLKPNTTYFLKYSEQTKFETIEMLQWNTKTKKRERVYWKTTGLKSMDLLSSDLKIDFENTYVTYFGCGPDVNATFKVKNKSKMEIWYKTEVVELSTNKKHTFYIKERFGELRVGHGMCYGAFTFNKKGKYKVRFTPMNIDGEFLKTTDWTCFDSPYMNIKNTFGD